jgi:malonyl CoA-acyl carrier protein transacylase
VFSRRLTVRATRDVDLFESAGNHRLVVIPLADRLIIFLDLPDSALTETQFGLPELLLFSFAATANLRAQMAYRSLDVNCKGEYVVRLSLL